MDNNQRRIEELEKQLADTNAILKAITSQAMYTYRFDLMTNEVLDEIKSPDGFNYSDLLGLKLPFSFTDLIRVTEEADIECFHNGMIQECSIEVLREAYERGERVYETFLHYKSTGQYQKQTYILTKDASNGHIIAMAIARDVSEVKLAEEKNQEEISKFRESAAQELLKQNEVITALSRDYRNVYLLDSETEDVEIIKLDGYIPKAITKGRSATYKYRDLCQSYVTNRVYSEDKVMMSEAMNIDNLKAAFRKKKEVTGTYRVLDHDEIHYYQYKYIIIPESGKVIAGFQNVDAVILREKERSDALDDALASARKANHAKTEFLFNMSHDIRTPMNAIIGFSELLEQYQDDSEKRTAYIKKIKDSSKYLLALINNILEMSRIESGKTELNLKVVKVSEFTDTITSLFENQFDSKQIKYTKNVDVVHPLVYCDELKVKEVLINVLSNSYKYTRPGGEISYSVTELPTQGDVVLFKTVIEDNGRGMSPEYLQHIFEEFSRERTSTESGQSGTGLGMAIVKKLVDLMDGTISVESELGKGTRITICLPHRIAENEEHPVIMTAYEERIESIAGKRILLAEDNDLNAEITLAVLEDMGLLVEAVGDGAICVDKIRRAAAGYYDLVLMDVQMPNLDGYEATRMIRAIPDAKKAAIPIVALTANAFEEDRKNALDAGMNDHISKPINRVKLLKTIARMV